MPQEKLPFPPQPIAPAPDVAEYRARLDTHREKLRGHMEGVASDLHKLATTLSRESEHPRAMRLVHVAKVLRGELSNPYSGCKVFYEGDSDGIYARVYAADWTPYTPWSGSTAAIYRWEPQVQVSLLGMNRASIKDARSTHTANEVCLEVASALQFAWETLSHEMLPDIRRGEP